MTDSTDDVDFADPVLWEKKTMAIKKLKGSLSPRQRRRAQAEEEESAFSLPTEKSKPSTQMGDYSWLIYGEKKIGKTSLAARFPEALHLMFEPGGKALSIYQKPVDNWGQFKQAVKLLTETKHRFRTIVIDTVAEAYERCFKYMCKKLVIEHPNDENDYGKTWDKIKEEFSREMNVLLQSGLGVIFLAHMKYETIETATDEDFTILQPHMKKQALDYLAGAVDILALYKYDKKERTLFLQGDDFQSGGRRPELNLLKPDGTPVEKIYMGKSANEAYQNLKAAWENKPTPTGAKRGLTIRRK